ncbi:MAG: Gfo/Idh/MocA family oxidoreductase [Armatimonadetes bacterium]|nr:Gfo/Idh/MocA family oxidoreductase [Armatimonadota bacterium]
MVRIGMLGSGFVADFYMQGLRDVPNQQVVVNYSRSEERARDFSERWGVPEWTTRMEDAADRDDVDLVLIALPNHLHREAALLLADHKKNMVCTKPLARSAAEAKEMLDAVRSAGVMHGYAETEVFSPAVMHARALIERGAIGDVISVRSREAHAGPHAAHFWDPELAGGGALLDMGCHCIEAARYFIGKNVQPVECLAWGERLYHRDKTQAEDSAVLLLRFEGGQMSITETSWIARGGLDLRNEIYGTMGTIFTDVTRSTPIRAFVMGEGAGYVVEKAESETGWVFPCVDEARVYGYHEEMRHFVACAATGQTPRETFEDGYIVNVILDAAYRSMKSKRWEPVEI